MRLLLILSIVMLTLAACGGGDDDTQLPTRPAIDAATPIPVATQPEVTDEPNGGNAINTGLGAVGENAEELSLDDIEAQIPPPNATPFVVASPTPVSEGALPVLPPGTLVASETEDPLAPLIFDYLRFEQQGGPRNETLIIEIYQDGRVLVNGQEGLVGLAEVEFIDQLLDEINFFGMQGNFSGPPRSDDEYRYNLFVDLSGRERMIGFREGFIPREVTRVLSQIRNLGDLVLQSLPTETPVPEQTEEAP